MSTSRICSGWPTSKKLSSWVRPGVFDVRASALRFVSAFNSDDLPTFDRPANATSGTAGSGRNCSPGPDFRNSIGPAKSLRARSLMSAWSSTGLGLYRMRVGIVQVVALVEPVLLADGQDVRDHPVKLQ